MLFSIHLIFVCTKRYIDYVSTNVLYNYFCTVLNVCALQHFPKILWRGVFAICSAHIDVQLYDKVNVSNKNCHRSYFWILMKMFLSLNMENCLISSKLHHQRMSFMLITLLYKFQIKKKEMKLNFVE